jgi:hypothetical protein
VLRGGKDAGQGGLGHPCVGVGGAALAVCHLTAAALGGDAIAKSTKGTEKAVGSLWSALAVGNLATVPSSGTVVLITYADHDRVRTGILGECAINCQCYASTA